MRFLKVRKSIKRIPFRISRKNFSSTLHGHLYEIKRVETENKLNKNFWWWFHNYYFPCRVTTPLIFFLGLECHAWHTLFFFMTSAPSNTIPVVQTTSWEDCCTILQSCSDMSELWWWCQHPFSLSIVFYLDIMFPVKQRNPQTLEVFILSVTVKKAEGKASFISVLWTDNLDFI